MQRSSLLMLVLVVAAAFGLSSCHKSDEEIKNCLVGTWEWTACPLSGQNASSLDYWFVGSHTFNQDGSFTDFGTFGVCKNYCDSTGATIKCFCSYDVVDGTLVISTDGWTSVYESYDRPIKLGDVSRNSFTMEAQNVNGFEVQCTCFERVD